MNRYDKPPLTNDSPFIHSRVECPICKSLNEFETIKVGAYVESGRDADFCPTGIKWRYPRYQEYNPLVFFTATCSNCFYSREFNNNFKEWQSDNNFKTNRLKAIKEKHLEQLSRADSTIKQLGSGIDLARRPNESAIIKFHLAIFDERLAERHSHLDLGRWYLRIAWIFRDLGRTENPNVSLLKSIMGEIESKYNQLRQTIDSLKEQSAVFKRHLQAQFETEKISTELKSQMLPYREKFNDRIATLDSSVESAMAQLQATEELLDEYKTSTLGADGMGDSGKIGGYAAFTDFLSALKKKWDGVVANEHQALEKAVEYYKRAFEEGKDITAGNQQIQASYLVAELSRRIGRFDQAKEYFGSTIKHGQEFIQKHREDKAQTALARKILELAIEQNRAMAAQTETEAQTPVEL